MNVLYYIFFFLAFLIIAFNVFIYIFYIKINKLEKEIINLFNKRSNYIPSLFEVTKWYLERHDDVFYEILKYRKTNLVSYNWDFLKKVNQEVFIHHEINFIFKVVNKHPKLQKNGKFLLIRDMFLENSNELWKKVKIYKSIINSFNKLLIVKNITILWLFLNIEQKEEI